MRQRFGTIRWKLTGTYILVSLLLVLTLVALLVGALLWLLNSRIILGNILSKLHLQDRTQAALLALRERLVPLEQPKG